MERKIRMKEIAKLAGVSTMTVSNVLHGRNDKIGEETRIRVQNVITEMNYRVNAKASLLAGNMLKLIVILDASSTEQHSGKSYEILRMMEKEIYSKKQYALIHFIEQIEEGINYVKEWEADGVIAIGLDSTEVEQLQSKCGCLTMDLNENTFGIRFVIDDFIEKLYK